MTLYNLKRFLLDVVYPNKCPFCNDIIAYNHYYCSDCLENLELVGHELERIENITETFAVFEYNQATSPFVYSIKDGGDGYAISAAAKLLCENLPDDIDLITCIPTDSSRVRQRGYNPPALIAAEISAITDITCDSKLLIKIHRTELQKSLSVTERRENIRGVFEIKKKRSLTTFNDYKLPKTLLLVDDVCTTGATLSEAAGVLLSAGVKKVYAAVVAAVPENIVK